MEQIRFPLTGLLNVTRGSCRWEQRLIWSLAASSETYKEEMVGWHHWLNGHEFGQTPGVSEGQGSLVCCSPWGRKELDSTERLNNQGFWQQLVDKWDSNFLMLYNNGETNLLIHLTNFFISSLVFQKGVNISELGTRSDSLIFLPSLPLTSGSQHLC